MGSGLTAFCMYVGCSEKFLPYDSGRPTISDGPHAAGAEEIEDDVAAGPCGSARRALVPLALS